MKGAGVRSDRICSSTSRAKGAGPIISVSRDPSTTRPKRRRDILPARSSGSASRADFLVTTACKASTVTAQHAPGIAAQTKSHGIDSFTPMSTPPITGPRMDPMRPMPNAQPAPDERTKVGYIVPASALRPIWPPSKHIPEMNTVLMSRYSGIATAPISTTKGIEMMNAITMEIIPTRSKSRPTMRLPSAPHQLLDPKRRRSREFGRWWLWCRFTARHPPERSGRDR